MKTVQQVSKLTGISVRTLHHYDQIGLLKPTKVTESGYRLYDETALKRLQAILFFRELEFPLKQIGEILDRPGFDFSSALAPVGASGRAAAKVDIPRPSNSKNRSDSHGFFRL